MPSIPNIRALHTFASSRAKSVDFHDTKPWVVGAMHTGEIAIFDYHSRRIVHSTQLLQVPIRAIKFLPGLPLLAVGGDDGILRVLSTATLQQKGEVIAHKDFIRAIEVHPCSSVPIIFTAGDDTVVRAWSLNKTALSLSLEAEYIGHSHYVMSLSVDPSGTRLATGSMDKSVKVWETADFLSYDAFLSKHDKASPKTSTAKAMGVSQQRGSASGVASSKLSITAVSTQIARTIMNESVSLLAGTPTDADASASAEGSTVLYPRAVFDPLFTLSGHTDGVDSVCWCESNSLGGGAASNPYATGGLQFIASGSDDSKILIWDTYSRKPVRTFDHATEAVTSLRYIHHMDVLFAGSEDKNISVINTSSMTLERTLNYSLDRVWSLASAISGASVLFAAGCDTGLIVCRLGEETPCYGMVSRRDGEKVIARAAVSGTPAPSNSTEDKAHVGDVLPRPQAGLAMCSNLHKRPPEWKAISAADACPDAKAMVFSPNGRFLCVRNDTEHCILSTMTGKRKFGGSSTSFAFASDFLPAKFFVSDLNNVQESAKNLARGAGEDDPGIILPQSLRKALIARYSPSLEDAGTYAIVDDPKRRHITLYSLTANNSALLSRKLDSPIANLFSGPLLAAFCADAVSFYDWRRELKFVCQINVQPKTVVWSSAGDLLALVCDAETYVLVVNFGVIDACINNGEFYDETEGVSDAISLIATIEKPITSADFSPDGRFLIYTHAHGDEVDASAMIYQYSIEDAFGSSEKGGDEDLATLSVPCPGLRHVTAIVGIAAASEDSGEDSVIVMGESLDGTLSKGVLSMFAVPISNKIVLFKRYLGLLQDDTLSSTKRESTIKDAIDYAASAFHGNAQNIQMAAERLTKHGAPLEDVLSLLPSGRPRITVVVRQGRVDLLTQLLADELGMPLEQAAEAYTSGLLAYRFNGGRGDSTQSREDWTKLSAIVSNLSDPIRQAAPLAFSAGDICGSKHLFLLSSDWSMAFLACFVEGDYDTMRTLAKVAQDKALLYRIGNALGDKDIVASALGFVRDGTRTHANASIGELVAHMHVASYPQEEQAALHREWKQYLSENGRAIIARSLKFE